MKIFRLPELADLNPDGDILLGPTELGSEAVSLLYGRIPPGSSPRRVSAGTGRDAVLFVVSGKLRVAIGTHSFTVGAGEAFGIDGSAEACIENPSDREAAYMLAAGRNDASINSDDPAASGPTSVESNTPCVSSAANAGPDDTLPEVDRAGVAALYTDESGLDETEFEITREDPDNPGFDDEY